MNKHSKEILSKLRHGLDPRTNIYRLIHGAADGWKGLYVDRLGEYLSIQSSQPLNEKEKEAIELLQYELKLKGIYFKRLNRQLQKASNKESTPKLIQTEPMGSPCHKRISMNLSMILQSNNIYLLIPNQKKLEVFNNAKIDKSLPLYYLLNQDISKVEIIKEI